MSIGATTRGFVHFPAGERVIVQGKVRQARQWLLFCTALASESRHSLLTGMLQMPRYVIYAGGAVMTPVCKAMTRRLAFTWDLDPPDITRPCQTRNLRTWDRPDGPSVQLAEAQAELLSELKQQTHLNAPRWGVPAASASDRSSEARSREDPL